MRIATDERGHVSIEPLTEHRLRHELVRSAIFIKAGELRHSKVQPPIDVVQDILSSRSLPFPPLEGVIQARVVRPDGSVVDTPGYDPATRLYYQPAPELRVPRIPSSPTEAQVDAALRTISSVIQDFRFESKASKSNTLGLFLTPFVRPLIRGQAPLALIDAPQQGTGKSTLAKVACTIATGRQTMTSLPESEEEMEKVFLSLLRRGAQVVVFDNIDRRLDSAKMALVLTAAEFEARILGTNEQGRYPQNATWLATGNNMRLGGDMRRRCYLIRLDSGMSKPYEREDFVHPDLLGWVNENRGILIASLLTLVTAWISAGKPVAKVPRLGSFEQWAETIGSILSHVKVPGFLGNAGLLDESDEDAPQWENFLDVLYQEFGETGFTTHDVAERCRTNASIREALPDDVADQIDRPNANFQRKLGQVFRKKKGARFGKNIAIFSLYGRIEEAQLFGKSEGALPQSREPRKGGRVVGRRTTLRTTSHC